MLKLRKNGSISKQYSVLVDPGFYLSGGEYIVNAKIIIVGAKKAPEHRWE